jgi:hypothetical protein
MLAFLSVELPLTPSTKIALLLASTVLASLALYHFCVRSWPAMRFLFSMDPATSPCRSGQGVGM